MDNSYSGTTELKHRPSWRRHQKQRFWQIVLPITLAGVLVLGALALLVLTAARGDPGGQISSMADASLIWTILPIILTAVVGAVVLMALVYLLARLLRVLPTYTSLVQYYFAVAESQVKKWSDKVVSPFIAVKSHVSGYSRVLKHLARKARR